MRVIDGSAQHAQLASGSAVRAFPRCDIVGAGLLSDLGNRPALPERSQGSNSVPNTRWRRRCRSAFLRVVRQNVSNQDLSRITGAGTAGSLVDKLCERDFSLFAICRTRAALPAATVSCPDNVVASALFEEAEAST